MAKITKKPQVKKPRKTSGAPIDQIVREIEKASKIALFHHVHPDGDTMSCSYGLLLAIKSKFPSKHVVIVGNIPDLEHAMPYVTFNHSYFVDSIDESYLAIVGDTADLNRIEHKEEYMKAGRKVCFDHHRNTIDFKADVYWPEPDYIASAMQAIEIAQKLGAKLDEEVSYHLMIGLLTDSNNFYYSRANPKPPLMYSWLLWNIPNERMDEFNRLRYMRTKEDLRLTKIILSHIKYDGKVAYVLARKRLVARYGREMVKTKVNNFSNIKGYPIWVLFIERDDPKKGFIVESHMRSIGPEINMVATAFGGGGHARAAGADLRSHAEVPKLVAELNKVAEKSGL